MIIKNWICIIWNTIYDKIRKYTYACTFVYIMGSIKNTKIYDYIVWSG